MTAGIEAGPQVLRQDRRHAHTQDKPAAFCLASKGWSSQVRAKTSRQVCRQVWHTGRQAGRQADRQTGREAHAGRWADR